MAEQTKNMTEGNPVPILIKFALPLVAGNVFQLMYTFFDTVIVGKFLGVTALAALGAVEYINWLLFGIVGGIAQGFTILLAQDFGNNDIPNLKKTIGNSIVLTILLSLFFIIVGVLGAKPLLTLLHTPQDILPLSDLYIKILIYGVPVTFAYNLFAGLLRSLGNSRSPLIAMLVSSITNIVLDIIFVMQFKMGIAGAAIATVIAQMVATLYCWLCIRKIEIVTLSKADSKIDPALSKKLFFLGLPLAAQNSVIAFGGMIVEAILNSFGGVFMASYVSVTKLYGLLEIAATSFGFALMTYVGQNFGAKKFDRIRSGTKVGMILSISCSVIIAFVMLVFGKSILTMFVSAADSNAELFLKNSYYYLSIMCYLLPLLYILWLTRSVIQGVGNTVMPMISGIMEFCMRTGTALFLPKLIGAQGIFYAEVSAWIGANMILVPTFIYLFKKVIVGTSRDNKIS